MTVDYAMTARICTLIGKQAFRCGRARDRDPLTRPDLYTQLGK
jgi:hypothetical protein